MLKLYLYQNFTPNRGRNPYFWGDKGSFINSLPDPLATIDSYTFDYQAGVIKYRTIQPGLYDNITYVRISSAPDPSTGGSMDNYTGSVEEFYHVERVEFAGGAVLLHVTEDYWANYAYNAVGTMFVTRCNRNIGNGIYDPIAYTEGSATTTSLNSETPELSDIAIYYAAVNQTNVDTVLNAASSFTALYANDLDELSETKPSSVTRVIDWATILIGGINAVKGIYATSDIDAYVFKAYIAPNIYQSYLTSMPIFKSKTLFNDGDIELTPDRIQAPYSATWATFTINIDSDYIYSIGTKYHGLELPRSTQPIEVRYRFIFGQSVLRVLVSVGNQSLDITEDFEVMLTVTEGTMNATQQIAQTIKGVSDAGQAAAYTGMAMAGPGGTVFGASLMAAGVASGILQGASQGNGKVIGAGNGVLCWTNGLQLEYPYKQRTYKSICDEKAHARMFGAKFAEWCDDFADIMSHPLLGGGDMSGFVYTYIEADAQIKNVPTAAAEFIQNALRNGIYIDYYGGNNTNGVGS